MSEPTGAPSSSAPPTRAAPPPPPPAEPARGWSAWDAWLGLVLTFVALSVVGAIVFAATTKGVERNLAAQAAQSAIFFLVPLGLAASRSNRPLALLGLRRFGWGDMKLVGLALLAQIAFSTVYASLITQPEQDDIAGDLGFDETTLTMIAAIALIVLITPIVEETLFRGLLFGALRSKAPFWLAAAISGALFAVVHLSAGEPSILPPLFFLGVVLAYLYERTGSLGAPIVLHMINNGLAVAVLTSQ